MSKAPGSASEYDGSGAWFKIKDWGKHPFSVTHNTQTNHLATTGPTFSGGSATWNMASTLFCPNDTITPQEKQRKKEKRKKRKPQLTYPVSSVVYRRDS
jgi:Pyruvate/2-oxoacid:ferredoxin oxidoreductase delta subunit